MSIRISIPTKTRDQWSGYDVDTTLNFDVSIQAAQALVRSINAQIPIEQDSLERQRQSEIERLESRLRELKGAMA